MDSMSYEAIRPLLQSSQRDGDYLGCTFRCPVSGTTVESRARLQHGGLGDKFADKATKRAARGLKWKLASIVRSALGGGIVGGAAAHVAREAMAGHGEQSSYSEQDERNAVVEAFHGVQSAFVWDGRAGRWVSVQAAGDLPLAFQQQLSAAPVEQFYDRGVLARMLTEVAAADGRIGAEERELLSTLIPPEIANVDALAAQPPLSPAELAECSAGPARETMLMMAWAVALTDQDLAAAERGRLVQLAAGLGIAGPAAQQLMQHAQVYLADQALEAAYVGGQPDAGKRDEALQLARAIGLSDDAVEQVEIRLRKRHG